MQRTIPYSCHHPCCLLQLQAHVQCCCPVLPFPACAAQVLPSAGLTQVVNLVWGLSRLRNPAGCQDDFSSHTYSFQDHPLAAPECYSFSPAWQAACLRELRLRCVCAGVDVDCSQLVGMLRELGVAGLAEGAAAVADRLFAEQEDDAYCSLQFQPGCR
jgi:hypothetical protein